MGSYSCSRELGRRASAAGPTELRAPNTLIPGKFVALLCVVLMSCTQPMGPGIPRNDAIESAVRVIQWPSVDSPPLQSRKFSDFVIDMRSTSQVEQTIRGALLYLYATQIRDRPGVHSSSYDHCQPPLRTCKNVVLINLPGGSRYIETTGIAEDRPIRNVVGEWANTINFLPDRLGDADGETIVAVQDSNPFVTAAILYPLYFIDEQLLPEGERLAETMRSLAVASLAEYKRGHAYSFWSEMPGETSSAPKIGPSNLPIKYVQKLAEVLSGPLYPLWRISTPHLDVHVEAWVRQALNRAENPYGFDAIFNIPNDADDTAIVVAMQKIHSVLQPRDHITPDVSALRVLTRFRDRGRVEREMRTAWSGHTDTGAFLTWLRDENLETFSAAEKGIIPLGANNIDCVINANVLFSLALNDASQWTGFEDAKKILVNVVRTRAWTGACNLYYPQLMLFPYALTRAYREGRLFHDPEMRGAMGILLRDILSLQQNDGSFPGGKDKTRDLSTALAANALLNIGGTIAQDEGLFNAYQSAVGKAIRFLVSARQSQQLIFSDFDRPRAASSVENAGYHWRSGLFFAGSFGGLAQWRSEAYSTAVVLEALVKFVLAYDLDNATLLSGRRLQIESYGIQKLSRFSGPLDRRDAARVPAP